MAAKKKKAKKKDAPPAPQGTGAVELDVITGKPKPKHSEHF